MPMQLASGIAALRAAAIILFLGFLAVRAFGPGDLWDQSQPRTVAYTADMLVHGGASLVLPVDAAGKAATKPPLYNWLALPGVALLGRDSGLAHRLPSIAAFAILVLLVARIGEGILPGAGWGASIMLVANYPMLKLGFLARPDMVLVLALTLGWWAATSLMLDWNLGATPARGRHRLLFWSAVVLAALAKGPPALLLIAHALLAPRVVTGRWSATAAIGWPWAAAAVVPAGAWLAAVAVVDRDHLVFQLWQNELLGRVMGTSREGGTEGLRGLLLGLADMPFYLLVRFLPWSVPLVAGAIGAVVVRRRRRAPPDRGQGFVESALLWVGLAVVFFSLSSGKRADYLAPAYPMAALVTAWWLCDAMRMAWRPGVAIAAGYCTMIALWTTTWTAEPSAPGAGEGLAELERLARGEREVIRAVAPRTEFLICGTPAEHLAALVATGRPRDSSATSVRQAIEGGRALRLVYEPAQVPLALRRRVDEAMLDGRWRLLWRLHIPWKGPRTRIVECVEIAQVPVPSS